MEKSNFRNEAFYWIISSVIILLLAYNLFMTVAYSNWIGLLPIVILSVLLTLILTKHKFAKIGIMIWSMLFLVIASGLQFVGKLMMDASSSFIDFDVFFYLKTGFSVSVGLLIFLFAKRTIEITSIEEE